MTALGSRLRAYASPRHWVAAQAAVLHATLWRLRELYNAALQERRDAHQKCGVSEDVAFGEG